jgi:predicted Zn-dependent protease
VDQNRRQLISEELNSGMQRALPALAQDPDAVLIGFTEADMYPRSQDWQFAYGWRADGSAVISTARLNLHFAGDSATATLAIRLRKVVIKDIGILYYLLPLSDDPSSVLYSGIMGIDDLDQVTENF